MFCITNGHFFSLGELPVSIKEHVKRLKKWFSELWGEQKHLGRHLRPICTMGGTTQTPVFALEMERSKNSTNHIMKGQMDFIWSGEAREGRRETCRQNQTAKCNNRFRERGRERASERGLQVVKKCEPSRCMQTACTE